MPTLRTKSLGLFFLCEARLVCASKTGCAASTCACSFASKRSMTAATSAVAYDAASHVTMRRTDAAVAWRKRMIACAASL